MEVDKLDIDQLEKVPSALSSLDIDKLVPVPKDLNKLSGAVKMKLLKRQIIMLRPDKTR